MNIDLVSGADDGSVTFIFHDQGHTLGNALRYMLIRDSDIEFSGET